MIYNTGERIQLLDEVTWNDKKGHVVGFDKVEGRDFLEVRCIVGVFSTKLWVSANAVKKMRTLKVQHQH